MYAASPTNWSSDASAHHKIPPQWKQVLTFAPSKWCRSRRPNDSESLWRVLGRTALLKVGPRVRIRLPPAGSQQRTGADPGKGAVVSYPCGDGWKSDKIVPPRSRAAT